MSLEIIPVSFKQAKEFVTAIHRHHKAPQGHKFSIGVAVEGTLSGVAMVGRPVSRHLDNGTTLEVNRLCTDGSKNACSMLYSAAWRAARAMGYKRLITYILQEEDGTSLRAANWKLIGEAGGGSWSSNVRPRIDTAPTQKKQLYEAV